MTFGFPRGPAAWGWSALLCLSASFSANALASDVLYAALHGEPVAVAPAALTASPGLYVGRAVRTQARVSRWDAATASFDVVLGGQRAVLRLEPEAQALIASRPSAWEGRTIDVEGLFYRQAREDGASPYALRAWSVRIAGAPAPGEGTRAAENVPLVTLEELVYAGGKLDGRVVRVRGTYRGANRDRDLPETTRKGRRDWVIKDGYFSAWVTGRDARGESWDLEGSSASASSAVVEVAGVPATSAGVVRIAARSVDLAPAEEAAAVRAASAPRDARGQAAPLRVSFAYPVPGETLGPRGHVILQFNQNMDPRSFEGRVRVRYEQGGVVTATPRVSHAYRERYRALVVTPQPPPPAGVDVVVELLEGVIDVDGNGVATEARFRSGR